MDSLHEKGKSNKQELTLAMRRTLSKEYAGKLLESYFKSKGFEQKKRVYPPMLQDIWARIPELATKIEVVPWVKDIDPTTSLVTVGWNLFVLGTNRLDLGESTHKNTQDLARSVDGDIYGLPYHSNYSFNDIIPFIVEVLYNSKDGIIEPLGMIPGPQMQTHTSGFPSVNNMTSPLTGTSLGYEKGRIVS